MNKDGVGQSRAANANCGNCAIEFGEEPVPNEGDRHNRRHVSDAEAIMRP
jgi:hypothetical protein